MNSNLHFRITNVFFRLNRTCSQIATLFLLFTLLSGYKVYATSITINFNQPAPVYSPATVNLTLPAVTASS